jgi:hypothetical protein
MTPAQFASLLSTIVIVITLLSIAWRTFRKFDRIVELPDKVDKLIAQVAQSQHDEERWRDQHERDHAAKVSRYGRRQ